MARFKRKYTPAQDAAVIAAQLETGLSAPEVARRAAAGELEHDGRRLEPFVMPAATARDKAGDARRERELQRIAEHGTGSELERLAAELAAGAAQEVARIRRRQARGKVQAAEIGAAARALRECVALERAMHRAPASGKAPASADDGTGAGDWLGELAAGSA